MKRPSTPTKRAMRSTQAVHLESLRALLRNSGAAPSRAVKPNRGLGFAACGRACPPQHVPWPCGLSAQPVELLSLSVAAPMPTEHCTACAMQVQRGGRGTASALGALVVGAQLWLCASTEGVRIPGFNAHIPPPPATAAASSAWRRKAVAASTHDSPPLCCCCRRPRQCRRWCMQRRRVERSVTLCARGWDRTPFGARCCMHATTRTLVL